MIRRLEHLQARCLTYGSDDRKKLESNDARSAPIPTGGRNRRTTQASHVEPQNYKQRELSMSHDADEPYFESVSQSNLTYVRTKLVKRTKSIRILNPPIGPPSDNSGASSEEDEDLEEKPPTTALKKRPSCKKTGNDSDSEHSDCSDHNASTATSIVGKVDWISIDVTFGWM